MPREIRNNQHPSLGERLGAGVATETAKRRFKVIMTLEEWAYVVRAVQVYPEYVEIKSGPSLSKKLSRACRTIIQRVSGGKQV